MDSVSDAVDFTLDNTQDVQDSDITKVDTVLDGAQHIVEGATDGVAGRLYQWNTHCLSFKQENSTFFVQTELKAFHTFFDFPKNFTILQTYMNWRILNMV